MRVIADRLEHPVPLVREAEKAFFDERLERLYVCVGDLLGGFDSAAVCEDGEAAEEGLLVVREQVVAPGNRRPERLLAGIGVSSPVEEIETIGNAFEDLRRRERPRAGGCELDR